MRKAWTHPRLPNDRLLLGMKGTLSEMELSTFRQRSREAIRLKASRGELYQKVAIGFRVEAEDEAREEATDCRCKPINLGLPKFLVRKRAATYLAASGRRGAALRRPHERGAPTALAIAGLSDHPRHLEQPGLCGRLCLRSDHIWVKIENGRKRVTQGVRVARENWEVLIVDHHEGYIGWEEYEANQRKIAENAAMKGSLVRGPVREGSALLAGLLRCGHCGRKLHVSV